MHPLACLSLSGSAFLAATLLPVSSELVLLGLLAAGQPAVPLWACATLGNTAGAALNWWLGRYLLRFQERAWFPVSASGLQRAQTAFRRYGTGSLLFTWLPVIGDPLALVAGVLQVPFGLFLVLCALGKGARYAVLVSLGS
jgi:membrane protein YqaA with SNARE-associated domain